MYHDCIDVDFHGTSNDNNVVQIFDGKKFAETVADKAKELNAINHNLAIEYLKAMGNFEVTFGDCHNSNTPTKKEEGK